MVILKKKFNTKFTLTLKKILYITISSIIMIVVGSLIHSLFGFAYTSRIIDILIMCICGALMLAVYYFITVYLGLPQQIFGIQDITPKALIKKFRH